VALSVNKGSKGNPYISCQVVNGTKHGMDCIGGPSSSSSLSSASVVC